MNINNQIQKIKTKEDLIDIINLLIEDYKKNKEDWQNNTIEDFLGGLAGWLEDMEGYYENMNKDIPENINWNFIATLLYVAKIYE